jgi:D-glycerate 3-kinase
MASNEIFDDKSPHVIPFILQHLETHRQTKPTTPFFIGLNGVQGAGKTVLVTALQQTLSNRGLSTTVFSLDDLYLTHADQEALAAANPDNPLLQHRGQPSTHDIPLALSIFSSLLANKPTSIPHYNKALFQGQGDRLPSTEWTKVTHADIILFEGWCVGFQPLTPTTLSSLHSHAAASSSSPSYKGQLGHNSLASITTINDALQEYSALWAYFDVFIHIDAKDPLYVYRWRLQQEATTRRDKGAGMTDDQVLAFVNGYYPAYELYTDTLRAGIFRPAHHTDGVAADGEDANRDWHGKQLRLVVDEARKVIEAIVI